MTLSVKPTENLNQILRSLQGQPAEIDLEPGVYEIDETLVLPSHTALRGNGATIKGSKKIPVSGEGLVEIDLTAAGITNLGKFGEGPYADFWKGLVSVPKPHLTDFGPGLELFYNGKLMPLSRYPESGFLRITEALGETPLLFKQERNGSKEGIFKCSDPSITSFENQTELLLVGYWNADWATQRHTVRSMDPDTGIIEVNQPWHTFGYRDGACYTAEVGGKFYVLNAKEAIRKPGQWCIDRAHGKLFVYLYPGQDSVEISLADDIFYLNGVEDISISGLNLEQGRKSGVFAQNSSNITLTDLTIRNCGAWGILGENCTKMTAQDCFVELTGGGGIGMNGGDRETLTSSENRIFRCTVTEIARWHKTYMAALELAGVGGTISECKVYDVPHFGIVFSGNNHLIEKTDIGNACYESNDAGAIYTGRDYTYRGHIIRNNYLHDLYGFDHHGCLGLYFDDSMSSAEVYGNIFVNVPYIALFICGGRDFYVHDNVFFNCKMSIAYDKRASRWKKLGNKDGVLYRCLMASPYRNEIWKNAYPELYSIEENDMYMPMGNRIVNNHVVGGDGFALDGEDIVPITYWEGNTFANVENPGPHNPNQQTWHYINK